MDLKDVNQCCLCGAGLDDERGNNPWPLVAANDMESECCDECNGAAVIPARMAWSGFCRDCGARDFESAKRIHPAWLANYSMGGAHVPTAVA